MAKLSPEELRAALKGVTLVTQAEAGRMLGIKPPNVARLRSEDRFPEPLTTISGGAGVWDEREIKALGRKLARERNGGG